MKSSLNSRNGAVCAWCGIFAVFLVFAPMVRAAESGLNSALESIRAGELLNQIKVLASDEFEGRAPASRGEEKTVEYLVEQFKLLGLKPGNPNGAYTQPVPLVGITADPSFYYEIGGERVAPDFPGQYLAWSRRFVPEVTVTNSEMVFVGYGVVAPEYGWDDFKDVDVRGKTIVMLVNDPAIPDPDNPDKLDPKMFKGREMTYYGRWTYKYEIASEKGAAAALVIHETGPAGYPFFVLIAGHTQENFELEAVNQNRGRVAVEGWLTELSARNLFTQAGLDFADLKKRALSREFRPVPLGAKANFRMQNEFRRVTSRNLVAKLEGSDPKLKDEYVIYTAHWDHLGRNEKLEGDQIFNGAMDNATGTAGLLQLAGAYARLPQPPKRSVLFLALTAEEKGLLGAKYYATHPLYPIEKTVANFNMDVLNPWGRTRDVEIIGYGQTTLEELVRQFAEKQGRIIMPDSEPEKGRFYRSDHFEFAKVGVPAMYLKSGVDFVGKPSGFGQHKSDEYVSKLYHKVTDEVQPEWDMSGAVEDLRLLFQAGYAVAQGRHEPKWKEGSEFKARRENR